MSDLRPGRNLVRIMAVLALLSVSAFWWSGIGIILLVGVVGTVCLCVVEAYRLGQQRGRFTVQRSIPALVGRDIPFDIRWTINRTDQAAWQIVLRDIAPIVAIPSLLIEERRLAAGDQRHEFARTVRIPVRGAYQFGPLWMRLLGPWGLMERQWEIPGTSSLKVLPETFSTGESLQHDQRAAQLLLDKLSQARQQGVGTEFDHLSEFRLGDDPRRIDWRTTARYGRPVVRRFRVERHRDVMIVIDCGRLMGADAVHGTKLDCAVDSALMLSRTVLESGDRCGLVLFDDQLLGYLPPLSGGGMMRALTESISPVQSRWRESDFSRVFAALQTRQAKRSLLVILSDIVDVETSTRFRTSLATLGQRHVVLFAALQTPLLRQFTRAPVTEVVDGARQAVAFRLLREREAALQSLRHVGVHVLDVEPNQLTIPLINRFIELRHGTLL